MNFEQFWFVINAIELIQLAYSLNKVLWITNIIYIVKGKIINLEKTFLDDKKRKGKGRMVRRMYGKQGRLNAGTKYMGEKRWDFNA